jgi:hypothetical protein
MTYMSMAIDMHDGLVLCTSHYNRSQDAISASEREVDGHTADGQHVVCIVYDCDRMQVIHAESPASGMECSEMLH